MPEAELHAKTTFRTKKEVAVCNSILLKLDFLIEVEWSWDKWIKEGNVNKTFNKINFSIEGGV
jgi:hypothetical protein